MMATTLDRAKCYACAETRAVAMERQLPAECSCGLTWGTDGHVELREEDWLDFNDAEDARYGEGRRPTTREDDTALSARPSRTRLITPPPAESPLPRPPRVWEPRHPSQDLPHLARWLPELSARSPGLARVGWSGHNGASSSARSGRPEHLDGDDFARAVAIWRHVRERITAGEGEALALLWTAYVLAETFDDPGRSYRAQCEAVAFGAAPRVLREQWKREAKEKTRSRVVEAPHVVTELVDGERIDRAVVRRSVALLGIEGPRFEVQAVAWGRDRLAMLWAPGVVPEELARKAATGFAPAKVREGWQRARGVVKERAVEAWSEGVRANSTTTYDRVRSSPLRDSPSHSSPA